MVCKTALEKVGSGLDEGASLSLWHDVRILKSLVETLLSAPCYRASRKDLFYVIASLKLPMKVNHPPQKLV